MVGKVKDIIGCKFGMLTVLKLDRTQNKKSYWLCKCECGVEKVIRGDCLKAGTISCGCYNKSKKTAYIDNRSKDKLYHVYYGILQRCNNSNNKAYKHYGARGIKCLFADWLSFKNWALSNGYEHGLTIERVDNNGNYEPNNCKWVTNQEQQLNKRQASDCCLVNYNEKTVNLMQLSKLTNVKYHTLYFRYKNNKPLFTQSVTTIPKGSTKSIDTILEVGETSK